MLKAICRGLVAEAIGTVALTFAERAEIAATGRRPSTVPGQVGAAPPWESDPQDVTIDAFHHEVYAVATRLEYDALDGSSY